MFFSRQPLFGGTLGYLTFLALCSLALLYHFYTSTATVSHDIPYLSLPFSRPPHSSSIPKILWYKLGLLGLDNDTRAWTASCIALNPDYDVRFLADEDAEDFVYTAFSNRPDILEAYFGLSVPILRADLLRYLLLFDQGGVWNDLDVECNVPISEWVPKQFAEKAGLVVGWEFDVGWDLSIVRQFASWTIAARPGSPHMLSVVEGIVDKLHGVMRENNVGIGDVTLNMTGGVVDFSGSRRLTTGVFESLGYMLGRSVSLDEAKMILQPVLLGDVLVMPGRSFAESSNDYSKHGAGSGLLSPQLVTHHYAGTWKSGHGGEGNT
jgi:alpha 1,6-mannosyltransferase